MHRRVKVPAVYELERAHGGKLMGGCRVLRVEIDRPPEHPRSLRIRLQALQHHARAEMGLGRTLIETDRLLISLKGLVRFTTLLIDRPELEIDRGLGRAQHLSLVHLVEGAIQLAGLARKPGKGEVVRRVPWREARRLRGGFDRRLFLPGRLTRLSQCPPDLFVLGLGSCKLFEGCGGIAGLPQASQELASRQLNGKRLVGMGKRLVVSFKRSIEIPLLCQDLAEAEQDFRILGRKAGGRPGAVGGLARVAEGQVRFGR